MKIIIDPIEDKKVDVVAVIDAAYKTQNEKIDEVIEKEKAKEKKDKKPTKAQVKKALEAYKDENGMKGVKNVLTKYGANLNEVDKSDYADLLTDLAID